MKFSTLLLLALAFIALLISVNGAGLSSLETASDTVGITVEVSLVPDIATQLDSVHPEKLVLVAHRVWSTDYELRKTLKLKLLGDTQTKLTHYLPT